MRGMAPSTDGVAQRASTGCRLYLDMLGFVREKVSKNKIRFRDEQEKFDLDLTYITPRIIAMGFPSSDMEGLYRNPIGEVYRFFELRHKDNYKLYNLCAERDYDHDKFHGRVSRYPFEDHNAPPIDLIVKCCADIHDWLNEDENHVVGINCKAGKGRTGLIICCYLMHSKVCVTSADAMLYYGSRRTKDGKGVTIASQQRYVRYYQDVLEQGGQPPEPRLLMLKNVRMNTIPDFAGDPYVIIISQNQEVHRSTPTSIGKKATFVDLAVERPVHGDVKIQFCVKKGRSHQNTCHFWFSTAFVPEASNTIALVKSEIDVANKDKKNVHFKTDFALECTFEPIEMETPPKEKEPKPKKSKKPVEDATATAAAATPKDSPKKDRKSKPQEEPVAESSGATASAAPTVESADAADATVVADAPVAEPKQEEPKQEEDAPKPKKSVAISEATSNGDKPDEHFAQRRKRAQSFYDTSSSDEGLSSSEIDEKHMDAYFAAEDDDDSPKASPKVHDEPKPQTPEANGSSAPATPKANGHDTETSEEKPAKKDKKKSKKEDKKEDKKASAPSTPETAKKEKKSKKK